MDSKLGLRSIFSLFFLLFLGVPTPIIADSIGRQMINSTEMMPSNTVILSNQYDARFSQDYSILLKQLRLEWIVLDSAVLPDSIKDKNLILLGHPDSEFSGQVIREILSDDEIEVLLGVKDHHIILEKENFWMDDRVVYICSGPDFLHRRNAAEEFIRSMIADAPPSSDWLKNKYEFELDASARDDIAALQYQLSTPELPIQDLVIDLDATSPKKITSEKAIADAERLFYLFSHGYSGYAVFNQNGEFDLAKKKILHELSSKTSWSDDAFAGLLHENLSFIVDFHMSIGNYKFGEHSTFWYDTDFELILTDDSYQFETGNNTYTLDAINDTNPIPYTFPSLNKEGQPIYRLGQLSSTEPASLNFNSQGCRWRDTYI